MPHAFDGQSFGQLHSDAELLIARALDHEDRLTMLERRIGGHGCTRLTSQSDPEPSMPPHVRAPTSVDVEGAPDVLGAVRELCVAARQQRQLAETILTRLAGWFAGADGARSRRPRVLVVDDSHDNRELLAAVLESSGFYAITARNGLEAVIAAHCAPPAVVFMDIGMPVLDGLEAARLLKESDVTRQVKTIAHTARPGFCNGPPNALFAEVLAKPASPEAIISSVRRLVGPTFPATAGEVPDR